MNTNMQPQDGKYLYRGIEQGTRYLQQERLTTIGQGYRVPSEETVNRKLYKRKGPGNNQAKRRKLRRQTPNGRF